MSSDRTKSEELMLTHEFLALMLGVRRPTVSVAADTLAQAGIIDYKRGKIHIADREKLQDAACECSPKILNLMRYDYQQVRS